jgi:ATP-binding cassette subfamily B protein
MTFAAVGTFSAWIAGILSYGSDMARGSDAFSDIRAYWEYQNPERPVKQLGIDKFPPDIVFEHVSYAYPDSDTKMLDDVSFTIKAGESIALVGKNGAGKTTVVKLMTGLYTPQSGRVLIGGKDISQFDRDVLVSLCSVVFQDIYLLAENIAVNIAQTDSIDTDKLKKSLELSGLAEKVSTLPAKEQTMLVPEINEGGVNFSGGEKQKLAIARAIYKDGAILILDEPTAALDPIAESEVYRQYADITKSKTALFISHRLASTRFCDRIYLLDGGKLTEEGTHDTLVAAGGPYAEMFALQASYYNESEGETDGTQY